MRTLDRRSFLAAAAPVATTVVSAAYGATGAGNLLRAASRSQSPNIVFIFADDWGWGDLGCHGHPRIQTPVLDRLAAEGADFRQFTVASPVCSPSRAAIMTGHFPARYSIHQHFASHRQNQERGMPDWLDPKAVMLPRLLREQRGYRTGHFGKWHLTNLDAIPAAPRPSAYGYDEALLWNGPCPCAVGEITEPSDHPREFAAYGTTAAVSGAIRFIEAAPSRPFFINLWIHETHTPVGATEEDRRPYTDVPEPQQTYYAAVTRADREIGRLLATLLRLDLERRTLVVFSSDNGPEVPNANPAAPTYFSRGSAGALRGRKRSLLMGGVGTPFLVRWPGVVPAGLRDDNTPITSVDLLPTFCGAAACRLPSGYQPDGENVLPVFERKRFQRRRPIFWEWRGNHNGDNWPAYGIRVGNLGLVTSEDETRTELYDLARDQGQTRNLAAAQPENVKSLMRKIRQWRQSLPTAPSPDCVMMVGQPQP